MNKKKLLYLILSAMLLFALSACSNSRGYYREGSVNPPATRSFENRVARRSPVNKTERQHWAHTRFRSRATDSRHGLNDSAMPNVGEPSANRSSGLHTPPPYENSRYPVEAAPNSVLIVKPDTVPPFDQPQATHNPADHNSATHSPAPTSTPSSGASQPRIASESIKPADEATPQAPRSANRELGSHTTEFNAKEENRVTNITNASNSINGHIVKPGETFSYNQTVGPTIERRGYKKGIIFVDGEKKEGFGGGVCQVSTTLSIAADEAGMTITERHDHSLPVSYAEEGEEAATSYGVIDFKFKNEKSFPVVIHSFVKDGTISVSISEV